MTNYCQYSDPDGGFDYEHGAVFHYDATCGSCMSMMDAMRRNVPLAARLLRIVANERCFNLTQLVGPQPKPRPETPKHVCPNARCASDHK